MFELSQGKALHAVRRLGPIPEGKRVGDSRPRRPAQRATCSCCRRPVLGPCFTGPSVFQLWMRAADNVEQSLFSHLLEILRSPR